MTSSERVHARLAGAAVDRVPNFTIHMTFAARRIGKPLAQYYRDYRVLVEANRRMVEEFSVDLLQAISDPYREACDLGAEVEFPQESLPILKRPLLAVPEDLSKLPAVDPAAGPRMGDRLEAVRRMREWSGGAVPVMGWVEGALALAGVLRGVSTLLVDLVDRPAWVRELLECAVGLAIRFARLQVEAGAQIIGLGDAVASQMSPRMYREFALPYERRIFTAVHSLGALTRLHICGDTTRILPDMVTAGADIIDLDWMVDWKAAHQNFDVAFCGNVDPVAVMLNGTPEEVREGFLFCLRHGGPRSFSAAGCEIPLGTPPENLRAHLETLHTAR